jgi:hypothetical protein
MGTNKFGIKTFESFTGPVVEFEKRIFDGDNRPFVINPGKEDPTLRGFDSFSLDMHEVEHAGNTTKLRDFTNAISIELIPDWVNKQLFDSRIGSIINPKENPRDVLSLAVQLICPRINYVIECRRINFDDIQKRVPIKFANINLNDIVGKLEISSELIRSKGSNPIDPKLSHLSQTVISRNRTLSVYIDETEDIGSNSLQLKPRDTNDLMFELDNLNPLGIKPPELFYHEQFKEVFNNGDDYDTVQTIMILIGLPYCESILKWIVFGRPNYDLEENKVLIKFICELCDVREKDFQDLTSETNYEIKTQKYLRLSQTLFSSIQGLGKGWKKMLYQIVKNEEKYEHA